MKNRIKLSLVTVALFAVVTSAFAQLGFNFYEEPRTICVTQPQVITAATTNNFIDMRMFTGMAKLDIIGCTNAASTSTVTPLVSSDGTNWSALANYAIATPTTINYTNFVYTNSIGTNIYMLPGSLVTPTAATAGFATRYMTTPQYTNSGSITLTNQPVTIGFAVDSAQRYFRLAWGATASTSVGAFLTARSATWGP